MADNETTPKAAASKTKVPKNVGGLVVVKTPTLDAKQPILLDQAADLFREQVKQTYGENVTLSSVSVTLDKHHVGKSATYSVTAETEG